MLSPENLIRHELIGLQVEIVKSSHPGYIGIRGIVIDETQKMLMISDGSRRKAVPKQTSVFKFTLPNGVVVEVDGKVIVGRPEDRVKKIPRRW
ncbi:ribonuclease P protein component 1 [Candidatus Bathyarchaeota archaeon]|nr:ribonuclease P protein component 1 [Candidatus Bathyarchaeota archaeon]